MLRTAIILSAFVSVISFGHSVISAQAAGSPNIIQADKHHGLRKAAARRLAEAGCTMHEIAAITATPA